ncbi:hypothetical protein MLD38_038075 [Melastoma candidum]|uniref:Uncharacterized protein n=1 Tax=Melastoma candidum TaxID=119954 RepID=A0ACB9KXS9_9MYRT|nr:hypothetical protein MLD38_038075 [Melastoma candidum]
MVRVLDCWLNQRIRNASCWDGELYCDSKMEGVPCHGWNDPADEMSSPVDMMKGVVVNGRVQVSEGDLAKRAEAYQQCMKKIEVPKNRRSLIPFTTWVGMGKSIEQFYGQPLHFQTNSALKQLDQKRLGSVDEYTPLDLVMHPCKAEAMIWLMEEIHRSTSAHLYIAQFWKSDPFL